MKNNDTQVSGNVKTYDELVKENEVLSNDISVLLGEVDSASQRKGWLRVAWVLVIILLVAFLGLSYLAYNEISSSNEANMKAQESIEKFEEMEAEKNSFQTKFESSEAEVKRLRGQIEQTSSNRDAAVERKQDAEREIEQLKVEINDLKGQNSGQKTKIDTLEQQVSSLEQQVASEKKRADEAEALVKEWEDFYEEGNFN